MKLIIFLFDDLEPRYEVKMPMLRFRNLLTGGLLCNIEARIYDCTLKKCTGAITRKPPCKGDNFSCLPSWHIEFPRSASPLEKLSLIQATLVMDQLAF